MRLGAIRLALQPKRILSVLIGLCVLLLIVVQPLVLLANPGLPDVLLTPCRRIRGCYPRLSLRVSRLCPDVRGRPRAVRCLCRRITSTRRCRPLRRIRRRRRIGPRADPRPRHHLLLLLRGHVNLAQLAGVVTALALSERILDVVEIIRRSRDVSLVLVVQPQVLVHQPRTRLRRHLPGILRRRFRVGRILKVLRIGGVVGGAHWLVLKRLGGHGGSSLLV